MTLGAFSFPLAVFLGASRKRAFTLKNVGQAKEGTALAFPLKTL